MPLFRSRSSSPPKPPDPLQTPSSAAAWFRTLPRTDAIGRQQTVMRVIADAYVSDANLTPDRAAAIEYLDAELAADRGRLITQYVEHAQGSVAAANRIWQAAYDVSQAFIVAYQALFEHALGRAQEPHWREVIPRLLARLIHFYGTDAKLRVLKSEPWIPAKWMDLHGLYRRALDFAIARVPLAGPGGEGSRARSTIEQEYVAVLLTHQLNTGTLSPAEIDWAAAEIRIWSAGLELRASDPAGRGFCVDVAGRAGLVRGDRPASASLRHLDTTPLTLQLDRALAALRERAATGSVAGRAQALQRIAILEKLRPALCPEAPPALPRDPRVKVSVLAQVRVGLAGICRELAPSETRNLALDAPAGEAGDAEAFRVGAPSGERLWHIDNRSDTGWRIVGPVGIGHSLALGGLVAVREPSERAWVLGVVRRVARPMTERVEIGVSILSARVFAVALHAKRRSRDDMGFVVDGVDVSTIGERFDALYLPPPARPERPLDARSLVLPTSEYVSGRQLILVTMRTVYTIALRLAVEQQPEWTWATFDVVGRSPRD